jgi:hypothetical protein
LVIALGGVVVTSSTFDLPAALDFLPCTAVATWERWLGWRFPHYDVMEARAAATLSGSKFSVVRVGWDGRRRTAAEWHVTLFTVTSRTEVPAKTVAAIEDIKPAGMVFHHVMTKRPSRLASTPPDPRAAPLTEQILAAMKARRRFQEVSRDPRAVRSVVAARRRTVAAELSAARAAVEDAIRQGLIMRIGFPVRPLAVVKPSMLEHWILYRFVLQVRLQLLLEPEHVPWRPEGVAVCESCAFVFRPRRRRTAAFCDLCKRGDVMPQVLGDRPFKSGELHTFRAPKLNGNMIVGWKAASMGLCVECGKVFVSKRRDAEACPDCTNKLRQRRFRERQSGSP